MAALARVVAFVRWGALMLLSTTSVALDVRWTPGPDEDARGNSFSSRRRFRDTKPGEKLPSYYYADESSAAPTFSENLGLLVAASVILLFAFSAFYARSRQPGPDGALPDAEQLRQARAARFGFAQEPSSEQNKKDR